jgi:hypothetical protein
MFVYPRVLISSLRPMSTFEAVDGSATVCECYGYGFGLLRCVGRYWHLADNRVAPAFVCFWVHSGHRCVTTLLPQAHIEMAVLVSYCRVLLTVSNLSSWSILTRQLTRTVSNCTRQTCATCLSRCPHSIGSRDSSGGIILFSTIAQRFLQFLAVKRGIFF